MSETGAWPKVLIVEDEPEAGLLLAAMIHAVWPRADVRLESDGLRAEAAALGLEPHLVISDIVMPMRTGVELCRRLRALPAFAGTRIVLTSAYHTARTEREALEAGADEYCPKPLRVDEFRRRCARLLGEPR